MELMSVFKWTLMILLLCALFLAPLPVYADQTAEDAHEDEIADTEEEHVHAFSYSDGIDENGFWIGLTALDFVELPEYLGIIVPKDTHVISDSAVQVKIDSILAGYSAHEHFDDRAVEDGDTVNIDYVGSIDGVEFDGGSTGGAGTDVTIGVTSYIDDFLEQLIGHMPGETFDVNVTFPEDYGVEELDGKAAVFVTTINAICKDTAQELTDEFVAESLSPSYGWTTIEEMKAGISADIQKEAVQSYVSEFIVHDAVVLSLPPQLIAYHEKVIVDYYADYAYHYDMDLDSFLSEYVGVDSVEELLEANRADNEEAATHNLIYQAIAEASGLKVSDEDIANFFKEHYDLDDYSMYVEHYGVPYLKQSILSMFAVEHLAENAVLEE
jgi:trigger factor